MAGGWKLKFIFYILNTTHEPLYLDKWSFVWWKIMDIPTTFIWIVIFFDGAFEYGGRSKFWGYIGPNAEPLCVEFCTFAIYVVIKFDTTVFNRLDNSIILKPKFYFMIFFINVRLRTYLNMHIPRILLSYFLVINSSLLWGPSNGWSSSWPFVLFLCDHVF
jgi:hypothetical protein